MKRIADRILTASFREAGLRGYRHEGPIPDDLFINPPYGAACWLHQRDPLGLPCSKVTNGRLEVLHLLGRQAIRRVLVHNLNTGYLWDNADGIHPNDVADLVELAEWDPRNAGLGCTSHHRRFDSHNTPELKLDAEALPDEFLDFVLDWGLESEAEAKFGGQVAEVLELRDIEREGVAW